MKNPEASIRARLLNHSKSIGESFNAVLEHYVVGRFLSRLSQSPYRSEFVLKGAQLFHLWQADLHRPTRDLDLLGLGNPSEKQLVEIFKEICNTAVEPNDGLTWGAVSVSPIRNEMEYGGLRVIIEARLAGARIPLQIDVGFGDAITPEAKDADWFNLLDFPSASLLVYPPQTAIAEKTEAAVRLGLANSRMKDFFDLYWLSSNMTFDSEVLGQAFHATFERRQTNWPTELPLALSESFAVHGMKNTQWKAFIRKGNLPLVELPEVIKRLEDFLGPLLIKPEGFGSKRQWKVSTGWT